MTKIILNDGWSPKERQVNHLGKFDIFAIHGCDYGGGYHDKYMYLGRRMSNPKSLKYDSIWAMHIPDNNVIVVNYGTEITYLGRAKTITIEM